MANCLLPDLDSLVFKFFISERDALLEENSTFKKYQNKRRPFCPDGMSL